MFNERGTAWLDFTYGDQAIQIIYIILFEIAQKSIKVSNVVFRFSGEQNEILSDLSMQISPREDHLRDFLFPFECFQHFIYEIFKTFTKLQKTMKK